MNEMNLTMLRITMEHTSNGNSEFIAAMMEKKNTIQSTGNNESSVRPEKTIPILIPLLKIKFELIEFFFFVCVYFSFR